MRRAGAAARLPAASKAHAKLFASPLPQVAALSGGGACSLVWVEPHARLPLWRRPATPQIHWQKAGGQRENLGNMRAFNPILQLALC